MASSRPDQPRPDLRGERLHVDDDDVDEADPLGLELGQLVGHVAPGEDAGVHGRVERLDLSADERRNLGQVRHAADLDPLAGEVLARAVGRDDIHVEAAQVPRKFGDTVAVRD